MKFLKNKTSFFSFIIVLSMIMSIGCKRSNLVEVVEESYENGDPKVIYSYAKEDTKHEFLLMEKTYYQGLFKRSEGHYLEDKMHGHWIYWYENGNKWSEGWFDQGIETKTKTVWHENGQKYYEGEMEDGNRSGEWNFWEEDGTLIKSINYENR